jgi:excinuclease ABC subunit C
MDIRQQLKQIPTQPGIYQFYDQTDRRLYIGKAKNLKNRVQSYFQAGADLSATKQQLVKLIKKIKYTIVSNETEAILLEKTLIRQYQPPYNIDLKDDKYFQYLKIDQRNAYPTITTARQFQPQKDVKYFGPYTSGNVVKQLLKLSRKIIAQHIGWANYWQQQKKPNPIGISQAKYRRAIQEIIPLFSGQTALMVKNLQSKMRRAAKERNYELAANYRDYLTAINSLAIKQKVVANQKTNEDYLSVFCQENRAYINLFKIRQGRLIAQNNFAVVAAQLPPADILTEFCEQYYPQTSDWPQTIISEERLTISQKIKTERAQRGKKKGLLELGLANAKAYAQFQEVDWRLASDNSDRGLTALQKGLGLKKTPGRIEVYDISNIQGRYAVGSLAVFTNGRADKAQYRRFKIKTIDQADDPGMLQEVLSRRFAHQDWPQPDLIILDGGPTQLNAVLKLPAAKKFNIVALAKEKEIIHTPRREKIKFKLNTRRGS